MSNRPAELEAQLDEVFRRERILDKALEFYDAVNPFHEEYPPFLEDMLLAVEKNLARLEDWYYEARQAVENQEEYWW